MKYLPAIAGALLLASRRKGKIRSEPKTVLTRIRFGSTISMRKPFNALNTMEQKNRLILLNH